MKEIKEKFNTEDIDIYEATQSPFSLHGVIAPKGDDDCYRRMPQIVADNTSERVKNANTWTSGGRVRFSTDANIVAIYAQIGNISDSRNMSLMGKAGFDIYIDKEGSQTYLDTIAPLNENSTECFGGVIVNNGKMNEYTINFPLYASVKKLYIVLSKGAKVKEAAPYKHKTPVFFYGSSITQGACASRPGNSYENILSRRLGFDFVNLGFGGSAMAEDSVAEYISNRIMSVFVYDYDHNAPDSEHLLKTHEKMFKKIREKNKDLPIICISKPDWYNDKESEIRRDIIKKTVDNAKKSGDENVHFIDGKNFYYELDVKESMTVDKCHPNDLGLWAMANVIERTLKDILN